jgi:hypothetical protein
MKTNYPTVASCFLLQSSNQSQFVVNVLPKHEINTIDREYLTIDNTFFYGIVTSIIFTLTISTLALLKSYQDRQKEQKLRINFLKTLSSIPCRNCYYFSRNPYLKCTLHPSKALSNKAKDCNDYLSKNNR